MSRKYKITVIKATSIAALHVVRYDLAMNDRYNWRGFLLGLLATCWIFPAMGSDSETAKTDTEATEQTTSGNFLALPIFITEPAIGEGLGAALVYFHGEQPDSDLKATTGREFSKTGRKSKPPPTATGIFGAITNDDTTAAGIGHSRSFMQDRYRLIAAYCAANSLKSCA